jgi:Tfp pilus assembly protein PilV
MRTRLIHSTRQRSTSAYTVVEVLVATLLLGTMVVSLYGGFSSGFAVMQMAREDLRATQILMQKMEAVRLCTWSQFTNAPIVFSERYDPFEVSSGSAGAVYSGAVTVGPAQGIPNTAAYRDNLRLVTATVYWTNFSSGKRIVRSREMKTLVARYGLQPYLWGALN